MQVTPELIQEARESEVSAVMDMMKALNPSPGSEPSPNDVFEQAKKTLLTHGLFARVGDGGIEITTKGQILLSIMMARTDSISEFVIALGMSVEDTTTILSDIQNKTNADSIIDKLMDRIGSGQPGLMVNLLAF